jgi:predicted  nucleic acid-binding Zn-ribbon protein
MRRTFGLILVSAIMAGCSSSPSDADIKRGIEGMIGGCPYVSLESFKKINGVKTGDSRHAIDVSLVLKISPIPGAGESIEKSRADLDAIKAKLAAAKDAKVKADAKDAEFDKKGEEARIAGDKTLRESLLEEQVAFSNEMKRMDKEIDLLERQQKDAINAASKSISEKLNKDCPNYNPAIAVYEPGNLDQYATASVKVATGTLPFLKTDNGWQIGR